MIKNVMKKFSNETWKLRIKKTLFYAIKYCEHDEDKLKQNLQRFLLHWKNDHSNCDKNCNKDTYLDLNKKNEPEYMKKLKKSSKKFQKMHNFTLSV
jgi:hypothetical protein